MNARLRKLVMALALVWGVALTVIFLLRASFPLELEWMEGGSLHQALRLTQGEAIYPEPGEDFVPFLYTPGYPVLLACLSLVFPLGYALGRVVSILAVAAVCVAIVRIVRFEGKGWAHALGGAGLFASGYVFTFRWLDIARADSLFLALLVWGLALFRESRDAPKKAILAGVLVALAFWTKQTAFVFVVASGVGGLLLAPRRVVLYAIVIALICGGGVLVGNAVTEGLLWTYIYELHQAHAFNEERLTKKTWGMFLHAAPFCALALAILMGQALVRVRESLRGAGASWLWGMDEPAAARAYWGILAAGALLVSALGYSTQWAEPNAFIPGVCFGAILIAVAMPERGSLERVMLGLVAAQLTFALAVEPTYQPIQDDGFSALGKSYRLQDLGRTLPSAKTRASAQELRARLESVDGPVLALQRPWWPALAGQSPHVGSMGINDVNRAERKQIQSVLRERVGEGEYAVIWLEGEPPPWLRRAMSKQYSVVERRQRGERVRPLTGYMSEAGMVTRYRADQLWLEVMGPRQMNEGAWTSLFEFEEAREGFEFEGRAFARTKSFQGRQPPVGPVSDSYLLSSAGKQGSRGNTGVATSSAFELPAGARLSMLLGKAGKTRQIHAYVERDDGEQVELNFPSGNWRLDWVTWTVPEAWADRPLKLVLADDDPDAALFVDAVRWQAK